MDLRSLSGDAPESQWREPMRDKVGAEQLQQVHHCTTQTGGSDCGPKGQRSAPSGSRRAATGVRNNRRACLETMEDHDRRFWHRWPLTWRSSHLHGPQHHAVPCAKTRYRSRTEEVRGSNPFTSTPLTDPIVEFPTEIHQALVPRRAVRFPVGPIEPVGAPAQDHIERLARYAA